MHPGMDFVHGHTSISAITGTAALTANHFGNHTYRSTTNLNTIVLTFNVEKRKTFAPGF